jgi:hypothetical protein
LFICESELAEYYKNQKPLFNCFKRGFFYA